MKEDPDRWPSGAFRCDEQRPGDRKALQRLDEVVDISRYIRTKLRAIRTYQSQCEVLKFDAQEIAAIHDSGALTPPMRHAAE